MVVIREWTLDMTRTAVGFARMVFGHERKSVLRGKVVTNDSREDRL